ncbi:MAG: alpha-glucuronidase [Clostridia bacterium]|nr:alpha-glucuronidase [Clostridia bacterium]
MSESRLSWLPFLEKPVPADLTEPAQVAAFELSQVPGAGFRLAPDASLPEEAWSVAQGEIRGGRTGILYGTYACLEALKLGRPLPEGLQQPLYDSRMIDCWDNMDGTVERGYAGRSLWFEGGKFSYDPDRIRRLGRLLASCGLNVLCLNNVNVHEPAQNLIADWLPKLAAFAGLLRPFGVRLMTSIDFSQPMREDGPTADPLDAGVQAWWKECADRVWAAIPDFFGFLVKADSEHRPGPFTYGRTHAEGANMLARAIAPHGGKLVWRAFVYNCMQDWRDTHTDRPCAAYDTYAPLDGQFDDNVILQVKNGPFDFQVREPVSPTFYAMPRTHLALEVQLAQEYTGQQIDIYAMPPMWDELLEDLPPQTVSAVAAVSNMGRDANLCGHPFAALNLYAFGRYAWSPAPRAAEVIRDWVGLTYPGLTADERKTLAGLLLDSRSVYEKYTAPLGLCWMVSPNNHYGPSPDGYEYQAWGTYHKANRDAVGIDRTAKGTGYAAQYPPEMQAVYEDPATCPDELLLFFHRLRYDYVMRDGRTLIQRIYDDHFAGLEQTQKMAETLYALPLPEPDRTEARERMALQLHDAREWCDIVNTFFHRLSGVPDAHGRKIWD